MRAADDARFVVSLCVTSHPAADQSLSSRPSFSPWGPPKAIMAAPRTWFSTLTCLLVLCALLRPSTAQCTTTPGPARAACFCQSVTVYKYYADTANGCTGEF